MLHRFNLSATRCCYGRPGCEHYLFRQCDGYTTHIYVFWDADAESDIKNFESEEKLTARAIWNFSITMGDQKNIKKLIILTKRVHIGWK